MSRYKMSYLLEANWMTINEAKQKTEISETELRQLLLEYENYSATEISWQDNNKFCFSDNVRAYFPGFLLQLKERPLYFEEKERMMLIYLLTFSIYQDLSVFYYQSILKVSKNTILADIKKLRQFLAAENIQFAYDRKKSFYLLGDEWLIRRLAFRWINQLVEYESGRWQLLMWINQYDFHLYSKTRRQLERETEKHIVNMIPGRLDALYYFICLSKERKLKHPLIQVDKASLRLKETAVYQIASELLPNDDVPEKLFLTILLMTLTQGQKEEAIFSFLLDTANEIIQELERRAAIHFENYRQLLLNIYSHLVPAYYRIVYGLEIEQTFLHQVAKDYPEISALTELALVPLKKQLDKPISIAEKAYFTLLFGAALQNQREKEQHKQLRALIVCPNGISTSMIMKAELSQLFPTMIFDTHYALAEIENLELVRYDLVFSSVAITTTKPVFLIRPIMTQTEKNQLLKKVQEQFLIPGVAVVTPEQVWQAITPHVTLKKGVTAEKILKILSRKMMKVVSHKEEQRPMLTELLTKEFIQVTAEKLSWQEAVRKAAKPLKPEYVSESYVEAMIQKVIDYGAFIHIGKGVALPHARPEDGVKKIGMSLLKVKEPVLLLDDAKHPITIFICLAAVDNESHLRALASLTKILSDKTCLEKLLQSETNEEIIDIMKEKEREEEK